MLPTIWGPENEKVDGSRYCRWLDSEGTITVSTYRIVLSWMCLTRTNNVAAKNPTRKPSDCARCSSAAMASSIDEIMMDYYCLGCQLPVEPVVKPVRRNFKIRS